MTKEEFKPYFDLFPKGNYDRAWIAVSYANAANNVSFELIISKWKEYLESCTASKTDEKYIIGLEKFMDKKEYQSNFKVTLQLGFLNKYKKK